MPIIEVNHVSKAFRLGQMQSFKQGVFNGVWRMLGRPVSPRSVLKALEDVNFQVEKGEVLGIIGQNGAGKSTLLKLLARISVPTSGTLKVRGRVAPLIEVGAGLVPDLTGRENVYVNGAILGMRRSEIGKKFDEIVEFSELEEFIDTPIKRYSTGMKVRLAFSVATSVDADILIMDEVLAVGDLAFQRKCFSRMEELIKRRGNTVLLVSHNIRQIERMCTRAILLDHGKTVTSGEPSTVCDVFFQRSNEKVREDYRKVARGRIRSSGEAELLDVAVLDRTGSPVSEIESGEMLRIWLKFKLNEKLTKPELIVGTHTTDFFYVSGASTAIIDDRPNYEAGIHEVECTFLTYPLVPGTYCVRFMILDQMRRIVFEGETLKIFSVAHQGNEARQEAFRILSIPSEWILKGRRYGEGEHEATNVR